ncbi:hypothetical protein HYG86_10330 [Alkalicella caledoniensis]|uniref:Oligoendopeptidase F n=1 Tax=Alkalicella caledoniensis TaxID=2731377 RepID=A0A7G9W8W7_ALKCA|nr:hypothetical protein [Alkalicella caledoniensis]QNO15129.1 hypothetical protein HYG86_10330 [Alkalicella caledoniensis]
MKLCEIRKEGEKFISELGKFYLSGGSGPSDSQSKGSIKQIYDKYQHIFTEENIKNIKTDYKNFPEKEKRYILSFLTQGYLGNKTYSLTEEIVKSEMATSVLINKKPISLRYAMLLLPAEKDREKRMQMDQYLGEKQKELNPLREKRVLKLRSIAEDLGYSHYTELIEDTTNINVWELKKTAERFLQGTEEVYSLLLDKLKGTFLNSGEKPLTKSDITYIFKSNSFDQYFPEIEMVPSVEDTLFGMGINIHKQSNITMCFDKEEGKTPRSFCCPVSIPDEIFLSFNPRGGIEDYQTSLHETGHCQYYANMSKNLPFEFKRLGDKGLGEGYAFLFQFLTKNSHWIDKFLNIPMERINSYQLFINGYQIYILRRFFGKLLYELEVFAKEVNLEILQEKYVAIMEDAVKVKVNPHNYLLDLDLGFNTPYYIKAWIFESYLREYLQNSFGMDWFCNKRSGEKLKSLWEQGQSFDCEEVLAQLGFDNLNEDLLVKQFSWIKETKV